MNLIKIWRFGAPEKSNYKSLLFLRVSSFFIPPHPHPHHQHVRPAYGTQHIVVPIICPNYDLFWNPNKIWGAWTGKPETGPSHSVEFRWLASSSFACSSSCLSTDRPANRQSFSPPSSIYLDHPRRRPLCGRVHKQRFTASGVTTS